MDNKHELRHSPLLQLFPKARTDVTEVGIEDGAQSEGRRHKDPKSRKPEASRRRPPDVCICGSNGCVTPRVQVQVGEATYLASTHTLTRDAPEHGRGKVESDRRTTLDL